MKIKLILFLTTCMLRIGVAQSSHETIDPPFDWNSPFSHADNLQFIHEAFGLGQHQVFKTQQPLSEVITSKLSKDGKTWEMGTKDAFFIEFYRKESESAAKERIFTSNRRFYADGSLILVDAVETQTEISILCTGMDRYVCFQLKKKPVPSPSAGSFIIEPYSVNSASWYVSRIIRLDRLGEDYDSGQQRDSLKSVSLVDLNTVKVILNDANDTVIQIDISTGIPLLNGTSVQEGDDPIPVQHPTKSWSEAELLEYFGIPESEELKWRVYHVEGQKNRVFEILDQFSDQSNVPAIKQRINNSFSSNP